jgi:hypothetical protein
MPEPNIKVIANKQFLLNARDFLRGSLVSVITAALTVIQNSVQDGQFTFHWKNVATISITAFIAYILKNWLEPSNTTVQINKQATDELSSVNVDLTKEKPTVTTSVG